MVWIGSIWLRIGTGEGLMIKSRRMRLVGHVARMGEKSDVNKILVAKTQETTMKTKTFVSGQY
jgi:hypothetical protein